MLDNHSKNNPAKNDPPVTTKFLPVNEPECRARGWDAPDFVLVTGDAYVDHPSFGAAVIGRVLENAGYRVGVLAQPDWKKAENFGALGRPRLAYLVTGGNIDSMVNHYTVAKKPRTKDLYSPGGRMGLRPDRAALVYANMIRAFDKDAVIVLGGLEASLRRLAHYDYWDDKVRRSILLDAGADLIVYGMGEQAILEVAAALQNGTPPSEIRNIPGTVYKTRDAAQAADCLPLSSFEKIVRSKQAYAQSFIRQYENTDALTARPLAEPYRDGWYVIQNPPAPVLETPAFDAVYALPYTRKTHPMYTDKVPALDEVEFSIISNRGCFGGCSFCALTFHQGRAVRARSHASILTEATEMTRQEGFKGYIHDVGGPTANFQAPACQKQRTKGVCLQKQCLYPQPCRQLQVSHADYLQLLRKLRTLPGVKKVFIRSGIRYDYLMYDKNNGAFWEELVAHHISGQLKVAPEHISERVLQRMGKPGRAVYEAFVRRYKALNEKLGLKQFLVPYLMSSHPGSDLAAAVELAEYLRDTGVRPEQVQDFYPTPGTLSTCMYYTEIDPRDGKPVYVPKTPHEKAMQRALLQYRLPQNEALVREALHRAGREDLIGFDRKCLIRPRPAKGSRPSGRRHGAKAPARPQPPARGKAPGRGNAGAGGKKRKTIRNIHAKKN